MAEHVQGAGQKSGMMQLLESQRIGYDSMVLAAEVSLGAIYLMSFDTEAFAKMHADAKALFNRIKQFK